MHHCDRDDVMPLTSSLDWDSGRKWASSRSLGFGDGWCNSGSTARTYPNACASHGTNGRDRGLNRPRSALLQDAQRTRWHDTGYKECLLSMQRIRIAQFEAEHPKTPLAICHASRGSPPCPILVTMPRPAGKSGSNTVKTSAPSFARGASAARFQHAALPFAAACWIRARKSVGQSYKNLC